MLRLATICVSLALGSVLLPTLDAQGAPTSETTAPKPPKVNTAPAKLLPPLAKFVDSLPTGFAAIPDDRKQMLEKLALFIKTKRASKETAKLLYVCTHNSRRSHMGMILATVAAQKYGIDGVEAYSGGTEATAFNPRAVAALERLGFVIANPGGENPHYKVTYATNRPAIEAFSKKYDDPTNPKDGFAAIMTCDQADKNCPVIEGSALRVPLHYVDPKASDGKPEETATYDERAKQIATEVFYMFSRVKA